MDTLHSIDELRPWLGATFVPTMGALHGGHCDLIRCGTRFGSPVVVSIFVNAHQFAPHEDFETYPRSIEADLAAAKDAGAAAVFVPNHDVMFPADVDLPSHTLPRVATAPGLEDASRPHFFPGVCKVVARLFDLLQPKRAVFGEKDWQQLKVIEAMVQGDKVRFPLDVMACPTSRASDGLALSSRNAYLDEPQRTAATAIWQALQLAVQNVSGAALTGAPCTGDAAIDDAENAMRRCLDTAGVDVEYAVVRNAQTLEPVRRFALARMDESAGVSDLVRDVESDCANDFISEAESDPKAAGSSGHPPGSSGHPPSSGLNYSQPAPIDPESNSPESNGPLRALIAARLGSIRLIDNLHLSATHPL
jgi:pantoate--beta-alanine ligase